MAFTFDGADDKIDYNATTNIENATKLSFSAWVYQDNVTQDHSVFDFSAVGVGLQLYFDDVGSISGRTDTFKVVVDDTGAGSASQEWSTGAGLNATWQHIFLSLDCGSATGLQFWVNGTQDALSPISLAGVADLGNSTTTIRFGESQGGTRDRLGRLAELAFWNRILTTTEIGYLAKGIAANAINDSLLFYAPLANGEADLIKGLPATVTGTTKSAHPPISFIRRSLGSKTRPRGFAPGLAR